MAQPRTPKLSDEHWLALRLDDAGLDAVVIAQALDIEAEAVTPLLEVARRKRAALAQSDRPVEGPV